MRQLRSETLHHTKYFVYRIKKNQQVDSRVVREMEQRNVPGIVPMYENHEGKKLIYRYNTEGLLTYKQLTKEVCHRGQFFNIVGNAISLILWLKEKHLMYKNLVLEKDKILYSRDREALFFLYLPLANADREVDLKKLFLDLAKDLEFDVAEDCMYVDDYRQYFQRSGAFSLVGLEEFMGDLQERYGPEMKQNAQSFAEGTQMNESTYIAQSHLYYQPRQEKQNHHQVYHQPVEERRSVSNTSGLQNTTVLRPQPAVEGNGTTVLSLFEDEQTVYAEITRKRTGEKVIVKTDNFLFGAEESRVDYVVQGNTAISRQHAMLQRQQGDDCIYILKDCNSTNGTKVNGKRLQWDEEVPLQDGDEIQMADEYFVYHVIS